MSSKSEMKRKIALGFDYEVHLKKLSKLLNEGEIKELNQSMNEWELNELNKLLDECEEILFEVGHIGVDFGYGKYELEEKYIEDSRTLFKKLQERNTKK